MAFQFKISEGRKLRSFYETIENNEVNKSREWSQIVSFVLITLDGYSYFSAHKVIFLGQNALPLDKLQSTSLVINANISQKIHCLIIA